MVDLSKLSSKALDFDSPKEGGGFFSIGKKLLMLSFLPDQRFLGITRQVLFRCQSGTNPQTKPMTVLVIVNNFGSLL